MGLLVEYTLQEGTADAQIEALNLFIDGLKSTGDQS